MESVIEALARQRRARQHPRRLHLRQRLLRRRAPVPGQEPRLRGGDPRAAADARPRDPRGRTVDDLAVKRGPRVRRSSTPPTPSRPREDGESLISFAAPPRAPPRPRAADRAVRQLARGGGPAGRHLRRHPDHSLQVRRERDRRDRALRPRGRPVRAHTTSTATPTTGAQAALASRLAALRACTGQTCRSHPRSR